ncbi:hypothetical protein FOBRF1_004732 [Fusarium oxysporum]
MADNSQLDAVAERELSAGPTLDAPSTALPLRKACEACRFRKIRCDRNCPCSHCLQAKIPCIKSVRSRREKRNRASVSNKYEQKFDLIDRRLETITQLLHDLQTLSTSPGACSTTSVPPAPLRVDTANPAIMASSSTSIDGTSKPTTVETAFVDERLSVASHSAFPSSFPQQAVHNGRLQGLDLDINETLDSLHCILGALKQQTSKTEMSYPLAEPSLRPSFRGREMPPIEKAVALLHSTKANLFESSVWFHDLFSVGNLSSICLRVYFSEDFSEADFIIANSGLLQLFIEKSEEIPDKTESLNYAHTCRTNLETALVNLPLHLPATLDMISALLLGAFHTIEISKPSLCWTLSSKASELSQTLGYHRIPSIKEGFVAEEKRHAQLLFWFTYFIDKSLSLRLGRASTIQDWDVTTPMISEPGTCSLIDVSITMWINTARCQGKIYESLYSPDSITQPDHVRKSRVQTISNDLYKLAREACDMRVKLACDCGQAQLGVWSLGPTANMFKDNYSQKARDTLGHRLIEYMTLSDDVLRLSLLTLVYRASPTPPGSPSAFIPDCLEAARATLQRHQDFVTTFKDITSTYFTTYIHCYTQLTQNLARTLLFAPFTPFIVLFCHFIESPQREEEDLNRLDGFVASIEAVAPTLSDAASRMHRLFGVLSKIAQRYTVYRSSTLSREQAPADEQASLNAYLTALGFPQMYQENCQQQSTDFSSVTNQDVNIRQALDGDFNNMPGVDGQGGMLPTAWMGHTTELGEWFEGNQHMINMLDGWASLDFSFLGQ